MWVANMHKAYNNNKRKVIQGMGSGGPFSTICKKKECITVSGGLKERYAVMVSLMQPLD